MDVNVSADYKGFSVPIAPAVEKEQRTKPQIQPVKENSSSVKGELNDSALHRRDAGSRPEAESLSKNELAQYAKDIQTTLDAMGNRLGFAMDDTAEGIVFRITDRKTGEIVRQIPSEEVIELRKKLDDLVGLLFDEKA